MAEDFLTGLRAQYAEYADEALIELAGEAQAQLVPGAREVLKAELARRPLAPEVLAALTAQIDGGIDLELWPLVGRAQRLPCPHCGTTRTLLNGFARAPRGSFVAMLLGVVRAMRPEDPLTAIGCQPCLEIRGAQPSRRLQPGQPWPPVPQLVAWVRRNAALLRRFESDAEAVRALLSLDGEEFLRITGRRSVP
jgi:hypothetical protein